ncbi:MAG: hypothetical protein PUA61_05655 [Succinatimonas hippei]|nr:hypothetical protein [Succinatimonas hippei]
MYRDLSSRLYSCLGTALFFALIFILGMWILPDFGVTCDEPLDQYTALVNLKYVAAKLISPEFAASFVPDYASLPDLKDFVDRDYGVVFHLPALVMQLLLGASDPYDVYHLRHILIFIYCFVGLICLYRAAKNVFSKGYGYIAVLLFLLSPRFFAESFYNGKDMAVVAFACVNLWTLTRMLRSGSVFDVLLHALSTALLIDNRIIGVAFFATTLGIFVVKALLTGSYLKNLTQIVIYALASFILMVAFFPYLWENTLERFVEVFRNMSVFRHGGEILYMGRMVDDHNLPWHYIPVWIGITTPIFILLLWGFGLLLYIRKVVKLLSNRFVTSLASPLSLTMLFCHVIVFGSVLAVIVFHSSLYNGWRQMYFVYPPMLFSACYCLYSMKTVFSDKPKIRFAVWGCTGAGALWMLCVLFMTHPAQAVYFNAFAGKPWYQNYDVDYWGSATHLAYEWMLKDQKEGIVRYCNESYIFRANRIALKPQMRERLMKVECPLADYRINNFFGRDASDYARLASIKDPPVYTLKILGQDIIEVYRGPSVGPRIKKSTASDK